jgi:nitroreductase
MEFLDLVKERHSIRKYLNKPVEEEKLAKILEAARLVPTAANRQPQKIYVYRSEAALQKIRSVGMRIILVSRNMKAVSWMPAL